jgi:hypothetical protein
VPDQPESQGMRTCRAAQTRRRSRYRMAVTGKSCRLATVVTPATLPGPRCWVSARYTDRGA